MHKNLKKLLEIYKDDTRISNILELIRNGKDVHIQKAYGGIMPLVSYLLSRRKSGERQLIIMRNKEEAAYLFSDLKILTPDSAYFLPDSFKRPGRFNQLAAEQMLQRTESIHALHPDHLSTSITVSYPEALLEGVRSPEELSKERIVLAKEEVINRDQLVETLLDNGFRRTEFVYEPGEFSLRGGIIDIFSFSHDWPYRIELFDEEIESIRAFDPLTQISKKEYDECQIVPNSSTRQSDSIKRSISDVLPEQTIIWIIDPDSLRESLMSFRKKTEEIKIHEIPADEHDTVEYLNSHPFITAETLIEELEPFRKIYKKIPAHLDSERIATLVMDSKPQPEFNKNFNLLIEHMREGEKKGYSYFILSNSARQLERLHQIFVDLEAGVTFTPVKNVIHKGFIDPHHKLSVFTDHQIFQRFHRYSINRGFSKDKAINLKMLRELSPGDYVTHIDHGIGRFSGLEKIDINGNVQESVRLIYKDNDILYVSINSLHKISKYSSSEGTTPNLSKLGSDAWKKSKARTKKKIKSIAKDLIKLYAKRKRARGFNFPEDGYLQNELESSFEYEDTPDQLKATEEMKEDMVSSSPMDRLVCGDVGFGKTEVAIRGAFKSVMGGKQVAVLVPTTILAIQHYKTFCDRLNEFGVTVDYINRFRTTKQKKEILKRLEAGEIDIIIGTHSLLNKKVKFKDLGLLVVDEEQKFGVAAKEKIRNIQVNVDTLTLTATPIPRTMQFSLMAARDMSVIRTPPPNRQSIYTEIRVFDEKLIKEAIYYEIQRGGQVYFVHNRVKSLPDIEMMLKRLIPDVSITMAHGQLESDKLEKKLMSFIEGKYDVLLCTNIIETGLDIPNVNTIIINNAHQFGMSDLHQLRGRVGRSNRKAYCYLFCPPLSVLTPDARKRLKALEEFSDLGSGFHISMRDLDIRGAGNLLGAEQSGFVNDMGYETYQKILDEAIVELKENEFRKVFEKEISRKKKWAADITIELDQEMFIPSEYIENMQERLNIYTRLDNLENEDELQKMINELEDRFGKIPPEGETLITALRVRWLCQRLGFERVSLKKNVAKLFFIKNPGSAFYETELFQKIITYANSGERSRTFKLKQIPKSLILIIKPVGEIHILHTILKEMQKEVLADVAGVT